MSCLLFSLSKLSTSPRGLGSNPFVLWMRILNAAIMLLGFVLVIFSDMKSNSWIQIIIWPFSHATLTDVLAWVIAPAVSTDMRCCFSLVLTGAVWDSWWPLQICQCGKLGASRAYMGVAVICQETEVQLTALLIISLRNKQVFAWLWYWLARQKWFKCTSDSAAVRKEDLCHGRQGQCVVLLRNCFNAWCSVWCSFLQSCTKVEMLVYYPQQ